ncbi:MAG: elongation factor P-like protein YeiP [Thalassolituus sp.]
MPKASEIKKNAAVEHNGSVYFVKDIERSVPQGRAGGSIYRMRMYDVVTGAKLDESFKDSDMLNLADLVRRQVALSYIDGDEYNFMDSEDFTMYTMNKSQIEEEAQFITEETQGMQAIVLNEVAVGIDVPTIVELVIVETAPAMKGASATSRTKPATLTTGLVVQVPEHIAEGDRIKVNTEECKFTGRAN